VSAKVRTLRVLTLNLWNDQGAYARRMESAITAIRLLEVDVIALQEVREAPGHVAQASEFARALGGSAAFGVADPASRDGPIGNAVISRLPMRHLGVTLLPSPPGDPRAALAVEVETAAGALAFVSTHLSWQLEASPVRERQVVALDQFAHQHERSLPTVMCGDFNATPNSDAIRFLCGRKSLEGRGTYWRDAFHRIHPHEDGYTWSAHNPQVKRHVERNRRIDFVFVGPLGDDGRGAILDSRVVLDQPDKEGVYPSDHFAVFAEMALDPVEAPR
jgi:endonuclease/exonuclease/phosphatase family metal-dependent hydrolase